MKKKVLGIILGGGQGSRLQPLTTTRSKPAVPIAGKYRLVDIPISNCVNSGIDRMFVLTQFNSASLNKHIKNTYNFSFFNDAFVDVLAAEQTPGNSNWFQGTADAVRQSMHHFLTHSWDYALILSGDQLYQMDFTEMVEAHIQSKAKVSIATLPVTEKEATGFGILKTDENNLIKSFVEKPSKDLLPEWTSEVAPEMKKAGRNHLASMGIYIFSRDFLSQVLKDSDTMDFGGEIIPQAIKKHKVLSYQYEGYWTDIGTIASFFDANLGLTDSIPAFDLFDKSKSVLTRARILPPSKITGTTLEKTLIAEGGIISASRIERSIVGIRSRIGVGTSISNAYIMGSDRYQSIEAIEECKKTNTPYVGIGERCYINNCIVDKNARIGNDVRINGGPHLKDIDTETYTVRDGIVVIKNGALIENGTVI
jgi:glucose-1-phosphate adenylyltransferase|tara:strand:- start:13204 stop:14472 length:1269 start_codon:yes stop_codon:yes gene_type:complete